MDKLEDLVRGKKVLVFGLGRQGGGTGDLDWLQKHGATVHASDKDTTLVPEGQTKEQIDWADLIIKNPGVPDDNELIIYAKSLHKPVLTSIALFVKYSSLQIIGVTGTRGKSTTVALISAMLEKVYPGQVLSGGNIAGTSCLALFDQAIGKSYGVLELSSFQLHNFHELKVSPNYALLTNIYPDHLNRYRDMKSYSWDKQAIHLYQKPGDYYLKFPSAESVMAWETLLPGLHNKENIAGAWGIVSHLGISESIARSVAKEFKGVPFRQEKIATVDGVTYINDTTATTPTAAIKALQAAASPSIWITGGDT
jgi:UDP-N-acetylmuramoylalanine--D-glutamate ligase